MLSRLSIESPFRSTLHESVAYPRLRESFKGQFSAMMAERMALAQYAKLHPHNIAQKVVVIVEHFREHVMAKIGGKAKAMLVAEGAITRVAALARTLRCRQNSYPTL